MKTPTVAAALLAALALAACGSVPAGTSGYLSDYARLERNTEAKDDPHALRWVAPGDALLDYDRLLIETYSLQPERGSGLAKMDAANARELLDALRTTMIDVVDPYYSVVSEPGPGVLRLRVAIRDIGFPEGTRDPKKATSIAFEAEMLDSQTGRQMAAVVRRMTVPDGESAYARLAQGLLDFMNEQHGVAR